MDTLGGEARVEEEAGDGATAPGAARRRAAAGAVTASRVEVRKGTYHDSVTLMQVSRQAGQLPGVEAAAAVAATPVNLELLARQGFDVDGAGLGPSDLVICVRGADEAAAERALEEIEGLLAGGRAGGGAGPGGEVAGAPARSVRAAARRDPDLNLAVLSVPGLERLGDLVMQMPAGHRGDLQAGRGRARPAAHGARLRHGHPGRGRPGVRQRRPGWPCRSRAP